QYARLGGASLTPTKHSNDNGGSVQKRAPHALRSGAVGQTWRLDLQAKTILPQAQIARCDRHHILAVATSFALSAANRETWPRYARQRGASTYFGTAQPSAFDHWCAQGFAWGLIDAEGRGSNSSAHGSNSRGTSTSSYARGTVSSVNWK